MENKELLAENCQQSFQNGTLRFPRDFLFFFSFSFPSISIRNASLCLDEIFEETFLNTVFFFLRNFQRNWAKICRTLTTTLQPTVKNAFYQSRTNFLWRFFYLESYKQLDNLFRKLSILFVQFKSKNTYYFWKVSTWLSKLDCKNLDGFFLVNGLFWLNPCLQGIF